MNRLDKQLPDLNDRSQNAGTPAVALLCLSVFGLSRLTILPVCLPACLPCPAYLPTLSDISAHHPTSASGAL